jgi:hypothetical protein
MIIIIRYKLASRMMELEDFILSFLNLAEMEFLFEPCPAA